MESFMDLVKIILQYLLLPALSAIFTYLFMRYKAKVSENDVHDRAIFYRVDSIVSSDYVAGIVHDAQLGYLQLLSHSKSDDLFYFNQNAANQFLDKKLQQSYLKFDDALHKLSALYAFSSYADFVDNEKKVVKLIYHKRGNIEGAEDKLMSENLELAGELEKTYRSFRLLIKSRFSI